MYADLWPLFGGYQGYQDAPFDVVRRQELRWIAQKEAEAEQNPNKVIGSSTEAEHDAAIGW